MDVPHKKKTPQVLLELLYASKSTTFVKSTGPKKLSRASLGLSSYDNSYLIKAKKKFVTRSKPPNYLVSFSY